MANIIISQNTTWHAGENHDLGQATVQIASGATLTIEGGVNVTNGSIQAYGTLSVSGSASSMAHFDSVNIYPLGNYHASPGQINIAYADINGGSIYKATNTMALGEVTITDSIIRNISDIYLYNPYNATIERNIFYKSGGISTTTFFSYSAYIKNNVFSQQTTNYAVANSYNQSGVTDVENNSFLSTDRIAMSLVYSPGGGAILASNNYFNTQDSTTINSMIYDKTDDLSLASVISTSHTSSPSAGTPRFILGTSANDILTGGGDGLGYIDGGAGTDTVTFGGTKTQYSISQDGSYISLNLSNSSSSVDKLLNVERLQFTDTKVAIDMDGNAGAAAKVIGAIFGASALSNKSYVGAGLSLLDSGMSYQNLLQLALNAKLGNGFSNASEVTLIYQNVLGANPSTSDLNYWVGRLNSHQYTQASLAQLAADLSLNASNINLVGLHSTGIEYV